MKGDKFIGKSYGTSMLPLISPGNVIFVNKAKKKDISPGDIVVYYSQGKLISHRVVVKKEKTIITKGDNSVFPDPPINYSQIIGKLSKIKQNGKTIDFTSRKIKIIQTYFTLHSLATYYIPVVISRLLWKTIRGRRLLVKLSASNRDEK